MHHVTTFQDLDSASDLDRRPKEVHDLVCVWPRLIPELVAMDRDIFKGKRCFTFSEDNIGYRRTSSYDTIII